MVLVDKPQGWTSHDAVAVVRRRLGIRAVGHTGTLDPFATGLLVVLVGRATRLARFLAARRKEYDAVIRFGSATDTDDGTGEVLEESAPSVWPETGTVESALAAMCGEVMQRPPAVSAKRVGGKRSYRLARSGAAVELAPVRVTIERLDLLDWSPPDLRVRAVVGSGTYVRAIARDLGEMLGVPAHCAALRRTAIGGFQVAEAVKPDLVTGDDVRPAAEVLAHLPSEIVSAEAVGDIGFGRDVARSVPVDPGDHGALLRPDGSLVAVGVATETGWHPEVVLEGVS